MVIFKQGDTIHLRAPYEMTQKVKRTLRGAKWNASARAWTTPATLSTFYNLTELCPEALNPLTVNPETRQWLTECASRAVRLKELQKGDGRVPVFPPELTFPKNKQPYLHQRHSLAFVLNIPKSALWLDLGLGKTYIAIHATKYRHLFNGVTKVLALMPRSILDQWENEINEYCDGVKVVVIKGTPDTKRRLLANIDNSCLTFALMTYESTPALINEIRNAGFEMLIMDESTKIKNPKAKRTKSVIDISSTIPFGIQLTGLAYLNNPVDLFSQFLAVDPSVYGTNLYAFEDRYIDFAKMPFGRVMRGIKNLPEIKSRAYLVSLSRDKNQCLGLPQKIYLPPRRVPLYDEQAHYYDKVTQDIEAFIKLNEDADLTIKGILPQLEKLQQITAGFLLADNGKTIKFPSAKYDEVVETVAASGEQFIIWVRHKLAAAAMLEALKAAGIPGAEMSTRVSQEDRKRTVAAFKAGDPSMIALVASLSSESKGNDWTSKRPVNSIYLENSMSIDERWQSESRQHRIGMTGTAAYIDVLCAGTIDEEILKLLKSKHTVSEYMTTYGVESLIGNYRSVTHLKRTKGRKQGADADDDYFDVDSACIEGIEGLENAILAR